jgi:hypothetical protein
MQILFLWAAAIASFVTFCVHFFVGGVFVARPLLADTHLPKASKWLNYYCWHVVSILLLSVAAAYAYSTWIPGRNELAIYVTFLAASASVLSAIVALKGRINPFRFPSTSLLAIVAALGLAGLMAP